MTDTITKQERETIEAVVHEFLKKMDIEGGFTLEESDGSLLVILNTADSGIVIGYHGEILEAMQLILSLMIAKRLDKFVRITVEVGDYRKNREEYLKQLALKMKDRAVSEQREQVISQLKPWERRVVHLFLQEDPDVVSESEGEGRERVLIIKPRS
ncbi:MAG: KH domain-containing protein [Candidatus Levybacteria bacterium]|nr:KH domain-containing protein [Candidatus Levybacteria bacterium]